jgi:hypothetical protein
VFKRWKPEQISYNVILFGNSNITFQNKPLLFSSFLISNIKTIQDIREENSKQFIDCDLMDEIFEHLQTKNVSLISNQVY